MKALVYDNIDLSSIGESEFEAVRKSVPEYGVVCFKKQDFSVEKLVALTKRFGKPVLLPEGLRFNNTVKQFPELARVSNILPDGTKIKNHNAAEYWHVDGDFWQPGQNYIFNFLYAVVVPNKGGQTGFLDMREGYSCLAHELKGEVENLSFVSSCAAIPDFKVATPEEYLPDAHHAVKHVHVESNKTSLYINYPTTKLDGYSQADSEAVLSRIFEQVDIDENRYVHEWETGDLLVWDNTSVMHRSMGGYGDEDRLLYRTQAFMRPC